MVQGAMLKHGVVISSVKLIWRPF